MSNSDFDWPDVNTGTEHPDDAPDDISKWPAENIELLNDIFEYLGRGGYDNQVQRFMSGYDRFRSQFLSANAVLSGLTFISRPDLNLSDANLQRHRTLVPFMTDDPYNPAFGIRCWLDPGYANENLDLAKISPWYNHSSPWLLPLCNGLTSLQGFPDPYLETFTTPSGFFNEDNTWITGGDNNRRTYDINITFKDPQTGILASMIFLWIEYMRLVCLGEVQPKDYNRDGLVLDYTVSIYRFPLDPTMTYIARPYSRACQCFPKTIPFGDMVSVNEGENFVASIGKFTVPFAVGLGVAYNDFGDLEDFNRLAERFEPMIRYRRPLPRRGFSNFNGNPYVVKTKYGNRLEFRAKPGYQWEESLDSIDQKKADQHLDEGRNNESETNTAPAASLYDGNYARPVL